MTNSHNNKVPKDLDELDKILTNLVDEWQTWLHNGKPGEGRMLIIEAKQAIAEYTDRKVIAELERWLTILETVKDGENDKTLLISTVRRGFQDRLAQLQQPKGDKDD